MLLRPLAADTRKQLSGMTPLQVIYMPATVGSEEAEYWQRSILFARLRGKLNRKVTWSYFVCVHHKLMAAKALLWPVP